MALTVTAQTDFDPSQAALRVGRAKDPATAQSAQAGFGMIRHEEFLRRPGLEPLSSAPGHVLDRKEGAVGHDDVVEHAISDHGSVQALDDAGEDGEGGGCAVVVTVDENVCRGTFRPDLLGSVDGGLHVTAVEVDAGAFGKVVEGSGEAEDVPE